MRWEGECAVSSLFIILGFGSSECNKNMKLQEVLFLSEGEILEISSQTDTLVISVVWI